MMKLWKFCRMFAMWSLSIMEAKCIAFADGKWSDDDAKFVVVVIFELIFFFSYTQQKYKQTYCSNGIFYVHQNIIYLTVII